MSVGTPLKAGLSATAVGAILGVAMVAIRAKYSFAKDWYLIILIAFAMGTAFYTSTRFSLHILIVSFAGFLGTMAVGWLGSSFIGFFEYSVPTPKEEREMTIVAGGISKTLSLPDVQEYKVKKVAIGGAVGVPLGWLIGLGSCIGWVRYRNRSASREPFPVE